MTGLTKKVSAVSEKLERLTSRFQELVAGLAAQMDALRTTAEALELTARERAGQAKAWHDEFATLNDEVERLRKLKAPRRSAKAAKKRTRPSPPSEPPIVPPAAPEAPASPVPAKPAPVDFTDQRVTTKYGDVIVTAFMQRDLKKRHGDDPVAMRAALAALFERLGQALQKSKITAAAVDDLAEAEQYVDSQGGLWDAIEEELDKVSPQRTPAREVLYRTVVLEAFRTKRTVD